jgi:hypothetical protein
MRSPLLTKLIQSRLKILVQLQKVIVYSGWAHDSRARANVAPRCPTSTRSPSPSTPRGRHLAGPKPSFLLREAAHRQAPLPHVLVARRSHAVVDHRVPLPHTGFGPERYRRPLHSMSSAFSCTTSSIWPLLTLPFPLRYRRNRRSLPPSTGAHSPPLNTAIHRHPAAR